jgi:site-specific DNA-methyltransferase (adenine-specific)
MKITEKINVYNCDNMEFMKNIPDNYYDLAIVDPPYGIGDKFKGGKNGSVNFNEIVNKDWDKIPSKKYFKELFRVSKNQIIWGGNYFNLSPTRCFVVWDKCISDKMSLAMCEIAWTSFDDLAKIYKLYKPKGFSIHPTEKPIDLYKYLLNKYAKENDKILDTHLGSMSIAIACHDYGFELDGCELDKEYFDKGVQRVLNHVSQQKLF